MPASGLILPLDYLRGYTLAMKPKLIELLSKYRKIHVVGVSAQEGRAVFDYLLGWKPEVVIGHESGTRADFPGSFMRFSDAYSKEEAEAMLNRFLSFEEKINFGEDYLKGIEPGDLVVVTQAWRRYKQNAPLLNLSEGIELKQAIELVLMLINCPTIGVTGTAGKSTTTAFISSILKEASVKLYFSGNDRENKWDLFEAEKLSSGDVALLEISHRHLMDLKVSPAIAVLTNVYPHHLDDAGSYENYLSIKKNIFRFQGPDNVAVINESLINSGEVNKSEVEGRLIAFGRCRPDSAPGAEEESLEIKACVDDGKIFLGGEEMVKLSELALQGEHNALNAASAVLAADAVGIKPDIIRRGLIAARPLKYRMEKIGEKGNLVFWNDGKSSDPIATIEAVKSVPDPLVLFLGGAREGGKPGDFFALGKEISVRNVPRIFVYGRSKELIMSDLLSSGVDKAAISEEENLKSTIPSALRYAEGKTGSVLFSPACQSFDEFKDYRERAETFNSTIAAFIGK